MKKRLAILLDTNALLLLVSSGGKPFGKTAQRIFDSADVVYVSSVSILEIRLKSMLGKLKISGDITEVIRSSNLQELVVTHTHADGVDRFPSLTHHDPFDRLLLSQAAVEDLILLTSDNILIDLNLPYVLNSEL